MNKLIKLILLFVCEMIVVVSAFLIVDNILDYRHEKKIQEAQRKELYYHKDLLIYCSDELTFSKVYEIDNYINDICMIYEKNKDLFEEVKSMIPYYVKAAKAVESIKNKCHNTAMRINYYMELDEYKDMRDIVYHSNIGSGYLRNRLMPLVDTFDEDHRLFVELIISDKNILELESINFQSVNSFEDILDLYKENRAVIKKINQQHKVLLCYYNLMKACGKDFTFDKVSEIDKWVSDNKNNTLVTGNETFRVMERNIPYYAETAEIIKRIMSKYGKRDGRIILDKDYLCSREYYDLREIYHECDHSHFTHNFIHSIDGLIHLNRKWGELTIVREHPNSFYDIECYSY